MRFMSHRSKDVDQMSDRSRIVRLSHMVKTRRLAKEERSCMRDTMPGAILGFLDDGANTVLPGRNSQESSRSNRRTLGMV